MKRWWVNQKTSKNDRLTILIDDVTIIKRHTSIITPVSPPTVVNSTVYAVYGIVKIFILADCKVFRISNECLSRFLIFANNKIKEKNVTHIIFREEERILEVWRQFAPNYNILSFEVWHSEFNVKGVSQGVDNCRKNIVRKRKKQNKKNNDYYSFSLLVWKTIDQAQSLWRARLWLISRLTTRGQYWRYKPSSFILSLPKTLNPF